jgi:hypothetical protein
MLTMPPAAADNALSAELPASASNAAASVSAAVAASCHIRTVRIGLRRARSMAFYLFAPGEAEKV